MPFPFVAFATRALPFSAALLIAGTALAAPIRNNEAAADCVSRANMQLGLEEAQCAVYPIYAPVHGECRVRAIQNYTAALAKCTEPAEAAAGGRETGVTGVTGVTTIKPGIDAPARRKFRDPAVQLQQIAP